MRSNDALESARGRLRDDSRIGNCGTMEGDVYNSEASSLLLRFPVAELACHGTA